MKDMNRGFCWRLKQEMIHNIFEFETKKPKDIMTHRKNLIAIDGNLSYNDAVSFIIENSKSRYPVYLNDIDNIIGVLHIKDAFAFAQKMKCFVHQSRIFQD